MNITKMKNLSKNLLTIICKDYFIIVAEIVANMRQLFPKKIISLLLQT